MPIFYCIAYFCIAITNSYCYFTAWYLVECRFKYAIEVVNILFWSLRSRCVNLDDIEGTWPGTEFKWYNSIRYRVISEKCWLILGGSRIPTPWWLESSNPEKWVFPETVLKWPWPRICFSLMPKSEILSISISFSTMLNIPGPIKPLRVQMAIRRWTRLTRSLFHAASSIHVQRGLTSHLSSGFGRRLRPSYYYFLFCIKNNTGFLYIFQFTS